MSKKLQNTVAMTIDFAKKAGADDTWANIYRTNKIDFRCLNEELETVQESTSQILTINIYAKQRYGSYQTSDLNPKRLKAFITEMVKQTQHLEPDQDRHITDKKYFSPKPTIDLNLYDNKLTQITNEKRLEWCQSMYHTANQDTNFQSIGTKVTTSHYKRADASSNGFNDQEEITKIVLAANPTLNGAGDKKYRAYFHNAGLHLAQLSSPSKIGKQALKDAQAKIGSIKAPAITTTMIVDAKATGKLLNWLIEPASAYYIFKEQSFWAKLEGRQAFSDKLSLIDNPLLKKQMGSRYYDDEGIAAKPLVLIDNGVINNFYVDNYYGRKINRQLTTGIKSNLIVTPGKQTLDKLIADVGDGIYVKGWLGGNSNKTTGDFSAGCYGHLIKNGKISTPIDGMNVTGNLITLFKDLEMVGSDVWTHSTTLSPSLVFSNVQFS